MIWIYLIGVAATLLVVSDDIPTQPVKSFLAAALWPVALSLAIIAGFASVIDEGR